MDWSTYTPIYVRSDGDDSNDGSTLATAVRTAQAAFNIALYGNPSVSWVLDFGAGSFGGINQYGDIANIGIRGVGPTSSFLGGIIFGSGIDVSVTSDKSINLGNLSSNAGQGINARNVTLVNCIAGSVDLSANSGSWPSGGCADNGGNGGNLTLVNSNVGNVSLIGGRGGDNTNCAPTDCNTYDSSYSSYGLGGSGGSLTSDSDSTHGTLTSHSGSDGSIAWNFFGCTDSGACNYCPNANSYDFSCEYIDACGICSTCYGSPCDCGCGWDDCTGAYCGACTTCIGLDCCDTTSIPTACQADWGCSNANIQVDGNGYCFDDNNGNNQDPNGVYCASQSKDALGYCYGSCSDSSACGEDSGGCMYDNGYGCGMDACGGGPMSGGCGGQDACQCGCGSTDCAGVCQGSAATDSCNVCSTCTGDQCECGCLSTDCNGTCGGSNITDSCGNCSTCTGDQCECGCLTTDCNGTCGGSASSDCAGTCGGSAVEDTCGVCDGGCTTFCLNSTLCNWTGSNNGVYYLNGVQYNYWGFAFDEAYQYTVLYYDGEVVTHDFSNLNLSFPLPSQVQNGVTYGRGGDITGTLTGTPYSKVILSSILGIPIR